MCTCTVYACSAHVLLLCTYSRCLHAYTCRVLQLRLQCTLHVHIHICHYLHVCTCSHSLTIYLDGSLEYTHFPPPPLPLHSFLSDNIDLLISSQRALLKKAPLSRIVTLAPNALSDGTKEMLECYRLAEEKYSKYVYACTVHVL